jgi:hypothetical protein
MDAVPPSRVLVDIFGDFLVAEALDILKYPQPKYDNAQTI